MQLEVLGVLKATPDRIAFATGRQLRRESIGERLQSDSQQQHFLSPGSATHVGRLHDRSDRER